MGRQSLSLTEQLADIDNPAPQDLDPEGFGDGFNDQNAGSASEDAESTKDENNGREHYGVVGKSKLRRPNAPLLGKQYSGAQISRGALAENSDNDDSDNPFETRRAASGSDEDSEDGSGGRDQDLEDKAGLQAKHNELNGEFVDPDDVEMGDSIDEDDEIDSDEAFGEGDEEKFSKFVFRTSKDDTDVEMSGIYAQSGGQIRKDRDGKSDGRNEDLSSPSSEAWSSESADNDKKFMSDDEDSEHEPDNDASYRDTALSDKAAIRALMAAEQKAVVTNVLEAAKADVVKGLAVKHQRETFNSLLNTRIRLQKALVGANSLSRILQKDAFGLSFDKGAIEAAESAATELFNGLTALRASISSQTRPERKKRPFSATLSSPHVDYQDFLNLADAESRLKHRRTLSKWAGKTQLVSSLPAQTRFSNSRTQPLTTVLDSQLSGSSLARHLSRTRTPRNCAPLQAEAGVQEDTTIYDDADWYSLLLRELVDSKMSSAANGSSASLKDSGLVEGLGRSVSDIRRENKIHRKGVDVKASKGRKMRYTVHEKLQNFDAPQDIGTWELRQAEELFAGLLGRKVHGGLEEDANDQDHDDGDTREAEGLRLFRGSGG